MINLNLDQLRTFVAACEKGSFSAVARDMGRAQSAVSTQIQNLELDLGLTLFDRSGKYPQPTAEAQALLPLARQAIGQLRRFLQAADSYQSGEEPLLRIVFEELVMPDKLNDMLAAFAECFPHTQIRASTASDECAIGRIAEGDADFAFVTNRDHYPDEVDFNNLGQQRVLTLACPEHPLAQKPGSSLNEAAQYRQLVAASPSSRRRWQLSPQTWSSDSLLQALDLACKGVGWVNAPMSWRALPEKRQAGRAEPEQCAQRLESRCRPAVVGEDPQGTAARWFAREARRLYGNYYSPPIETTDRI
ncbi:LysR family transcriptional regulator [Microbulbifer taiwanensis]|uniref:LysR family transcriptional regulator n=1 Tax=Microbulbifer taiwanensis TaxID=986746 RepID=UPI003611EF2F